MYIFVYSMMSDEMNIRTRLDFIEVDQEFGVLQSPYTAREFFCVLWACYIPRVLGYMPLVLVDAVLSLFIQFLELTYFAVISMAVCDCVDVL